MIDGLAHIRKPYNLSSKTMWEKLCIRLVLLEIVHASTIIKVISGF